MCQKVGVCSASNTDVKAVARDALPTCDDCVARVEGLADLMHSGTINIEQGLRKKHGSVTKGMIHRLT